MLASPAKKRWRTLPLAKNRVKDQGYGVGKRRNLGQPKEIIPSSWCSAVAAHFGRWITSIVSVDRRDLSRALKFTKAVIPPFLAGACPAPRRKPASLELAQGNRVTEGF